MTPPGKVDKRGGGEAVSVFTPDLVPGAKSVLTARAGATVTRAHAVNLSPALGFNVAGVGFTAGFG